MSREPAPAALFGTDGIRAPFGSHPLDRSTVTAIGELVAAGAGGASTRLVLGGDTRDSTPRLRAWLAAGIRRAGAEPLDGGLLPTPAIAFLVRELGAAGGIAVSASHNPHPDNGIKLFSSTGYKWTTAAERELERALRRAAARDAEGAVDDRPETVDGNLARRYLESLAARLGGERPLSGLRLVIDAAHGAATPHAAPLFESLGAEVVSLFDRPDGRNINQGCGSTHPQAMAEAVVAEGADLGIAFDGDADRMVFADERGRLRDGDAVLFLWARDLAARGLLDPPRVVATTMSNLGLERALAAAGIELVRCAVGDREVVETMRREGLALGGEQSGHVVHLPSSTTGDGLLTALRVAEIAARAGRPLSELLQGFTRFPQVLLNVPVARKPELLSLAGVAAAAREVEGRLGDAGRLVLRYSGTEPLARVMIEGPELAMIEALAERIAESIREEVGS